MIRDKITERVLDGLGLHAECDDTCKGRDEELILAREVAERILDDVRRAGFRQE